MNRTEAHALLNAARDGGDISEGRISVALRMTGDLDESDSVQIHKPVGTWERRFARVPKPATWVDGLRLMEAA